MPRRPRRTMSSLTTFVSTIWQGPGPRSPLARGGGVHRHFWYCHLMVADQVTLCAVMHSSRVCPTVGKRGRVILLLKNPDEPI